MNDYDPMKRFERTRDKALEEMDMRAARIKSASIHAQVEEAMQLASNKDRAQVEAAIAEAQATGVGILVDGKHVPYDIYQANHAVTRAAQKRSIVGKPHLRVFSSKGWARWAASFHGYVGYGRTARDAFDRLTVIYNDATMNNRSC